MAAQTQTQTQEKPRMEQAFALWRKQSKKGTFYFEGTGNLVAFYTEKEKPNQPDLKVYSKGEDGKLGKEFCALWVNATDKGYKYLTGSIGDQKVVGFIAKEDTTGTKKPYISVFYDDRKNGQEVPDSPVKPEEVFNEPVKEVPVKEAAKKYAF